MIRFVRSRRLPLVLAGSLVTFLACTEEEAKLEQSFDQSAADALDNGNMLREDQADDGGLVVGGKGSGGGSVGLKPPTFALMDYRIGFEPPPTGGLCQKDTSWRFYSDDPTALAGLGSEFGPYRGSCHLILNNNINGGSNLTASSGDTLLDSSWDPDDILADDTIVTAKLHMDLSGKTNSVLNFWFKHNDDDLKGYSYPGGHNPASRAADGDGLWFSSDGGVTFYRASPLHNPNLGINFREMFYGYHNTGDVRVGLLPGQWYPISIDVDQRIAAINAALPSGAAPLTLSPNFVIRFQHRNNRGAAEKGWFVDNLSMVEVASADAAGPVIRNVTARDTWSGDLVEGVLSGTVQFCAEGVASRDLLRLESAEMTLFSKGVPLDGRFSILQYAGYPYTDQRANTFMACLRNINILDLPDGDLKLEVRMIDEYSKEAVEQRFYIVDTYHKAPPPPQDLE